MLVKLELIYSVRLNAHSIASSMNTHSRQESEFATVFFFCFQLPHTRERGDSPPPPPPSSDEIVKIVKIVRESCVWWNKERHNVNVECRSLDRDYCSTMWENYKSSKSSHNSQSKWARYRENWNIQTIAKLILFYFLHFNKYREKKIKSAMKLLFRLINYLFYFFFIIIFLLWHVCSHC